jgi:hypothetical protein
VPQQIPGDVAVHQAVADYERHVVNEPQAEEQSDQQCRASPYPEPPSLSVHLAASY